MLANRIIPCLDVNRGRVVKGVNFVNLVDAGDPIEQAKIYEKEAADELVFLDITASSDGRDIVLDMVKHVAETVFIPFTVGGGIRTIDDIRAIVSAGADKVSINSSAVKDPSIISMGAKAYGDQCIVLGVDCKKRSNGSGWDVYVHGGRTNTGLDVVEWIKKGVSLGAGEILLTSMDADGTKNGFDVELTHAVTSAVNVPVIASGGCGNPQHFVDVIEKGGASAVLAASIFHFKEYSIADVKHYMRDKGIEVRL